jgi:hypothetical protein
LEIVLMESRLTTETLATPSWSGVKRTSAGEFLTWVVS